MKHEKIVFFDIDGTLLNEEKQLLASTKLAVQRLQEAGVYTAIATGRPPKMFHEILEELNISSYVSTNGQYVVFEGMEIYSNPMATTELDQLVTHAQQNGHTMAFYNDQSIWVNTENHPFIQQSFQTLQMGYPKIAADFHKHSHVHQGILFCTEREEQLYREQYPHFDFIRWHELALDVLPQGCSKASGIQQLLAHTGFQREQVYAFGDGLNDVQMLSFVGTGVAMGNAEEMLKKQADYITTSCNEHGIWNGLVALGLLEE